MPASSHVTPVAGKSWRITERVTYVFSRQSVLLSSKERWNRRDWRVSSARRDRQSSFSRTATYLMQVKSGHSGTFNDTVGYCARQQLQLADEQTSICCNRDRHVPIVTPPETRCRTVRLMESVT